MWGFQEIQAQGRVVMDGMIFGGCEVPMMPIRTGLSKKGLTRPVNVKDIVLRTAISCNLNLIDSYSIVCYDMQIFSIFR